MYTNLYKHTEHILYRNANIYLKVDIKKEYLLGMIRNSKVPLN